MQTKQYCGGIKIGVMSRRTINSHFKLPMGRPVGNMGVDMQEFRENEWRGKKIVTGAFLPDKFPKTLAQEIFQGMIKQCKNLVR